MKREAAAKVAAYIGQMTDDEMPNWARASVMNQLHRCTHPDTEEAIWPGGFTMLSRTQTAAVWDAIRQLPASARPNKVRHAFDLVLLNLRQDTGEVMLGREDLAQKIGCSADHVSHVMSTLERMNVIRRERRRIDGVQGRGNVVYFINSHVAWNGSLEIRKEEAAETTPPMLTLMQGGKVKA